MGTKDNPGKFDCYANAKDGEPMFVLLGRDPLAPKLVELWAEMRMALGANVGPNDEMDKAMEAYDCAKQMRDYLRQIGRQETGIELGSKGFSIPLGETLRQLKGRVK